MYKTGGVNIGASTRAIIVSDERPRPINCTGCKYHLSKTMQSDEQLSASPVHLTVGVEPRRHQAHGKVLGCQHSARDTMVFIAGAAITHQYGNAVGSNAELGARVAGLSISLP